MKSDTTNRHLRDDIRIAVLEWMREQAPTAIKMMMTNDLSDELINMIEKRLRDA